MSEPEKPNRVAQLIEEIRRLTADERCDVVYGMKEFMCTDCGSSSGPARHCACRYED